MDSDRDNPRIEPRLIDRRTLAQLLGMAAGGAAAALAFRPSRTSATEASDPGCGTCFQACIEDFWREGDGDMCDPNFDWLPLVMRAQTEWTDPIRGFTLQFGPRAYSFSATIELIRSMHLLGSGGVGWYAGTRFIFPTGVRGIRCRASWSIVERIALHGPGLSETDRTAHAVIMVGRMKLRDVYITGFGGNGIHIDASLPDGDASGWLIDQCRIDLCGGQGIYVHGGDSSAGCAIAVDVADCRGWGIWDDGFLGNTYVACQVDNVSLPGLGAYRSTQSAPNLFLNCYTEGNQHSEFRSPAIVIGGVTSLAPFVGDGVVITGGTGALGASFPNGVAGANGHDPNNPVIGQLGSKINAGVALELWTRDQNAWYSLRYAPPGRPGWWEMVWSGSPDRAFPFRFSDALSTAGPGQFWMPNGYFVGGPQLLTATDNGPPTDRPNGGRTFWKQGDRVLNVQPSTGGFAGWICVESGTPDSPLGQWRGFGRIE